MHQPPSAAAYSTDISATSCCGTAVPHSATYVCSTAVLKRVQQCSAYLSKLLSELVDHVLLLPLKLVLNVHLLLAELYDPSPTPQNIT